MQKTILALGSLALAWFGAEQERPAPSPVLRLKEERMTLEYTVGADEATLVVEAETETPLDGVEVVSPTGKALLRVRAFRGERSSLSGFRIETQEGSLDELLEAYPEGTYGLRGLSRRGTLARGTAGFSHDLLVAPDVLYPPEGAADVPTVFTVAWIPDPRAAAYRVVLEQGENDGLTVELPPGSSSLQVPPGVLAPGTESHVEIGAVGANGNCTLVEVEFSTR